MRTAKHRKIKNKTLKGGHIPNTKVNLIVRKSNIDQSNEKLIYDLIITRPAFPFITDYMYYNMNAVDEALALMRMKEIPVKSEIGTVNEQESDVLYKDEFEYGYNKIDDDDTASNLAVAPKKRSTTPSERVPLPSTQATVPPISAVAPSTQTAASSKPSTVPSDQINDAAKKMYIASSEAARKMVSEYGNKTRLDVKREQSVSRKKRSKAKKQSKSK
jgi:hypothetical protein